MQVVTALLIGAYKTAVNMISLPFRTQIIRREDSWKYAMISWEMFTRSKCDGRCECVIL